jgi:predicted dinucleotide-binding enzyme
MYITIIGAGNMARGSATRALSGRHTVRIIDRDPDKAAHLAAGLQENAAMRPWRWEPMCIRPSAPCESLIARGFRVGIPVRLTCPGPSRRGWSR